MFDVSLAVALVVVCLGGTVLTVFQLPGTWLIAAAAVGYGWYWDWQRVGPWAVGAVLGVAVVAEAGEQFCGVWFSGRAGGSRRAAWWGMVGGLAGALLLTVPVPIVGTIIGAAIGCFVGALSAELSLQKEAAVGARVGLHAALGRTVGTVLKTAAALIMSAVALGAAFM